jgi:hypothetical protein
MHVLDVGPEMLLGPEVNQFLQLVKHFVVTGAKPDELLLWSI